MKNLNRLVILLIFILFTFLISVSVHAVSVTDSEGNTRSCSDFSSKKIHDLEFEYGRYPPPCPTCDDPKYHVGKEHYVLKDKQGYPKTFDQIVPNSYGYAKDTEKDYWTYYEEKKASLVPHEGSVRYTEYMGEGSMTITDGAATLATQTQFLDSFVPDDRCKPGAQLSETSDEFEESDTSQEIDNEPDEYVEIAQINNPLEEQLDEPVTDCDPEITGKIFDEKLKKCVEACPEDQIWQGGGCIDIDTETSIDKNSCESIIHGATAENFDLKYDRKTLRDHLFKAVNEYGSVKQGTDTFSGWNPLYALGLGIHLARAGSTGFEAKGQDKLADALRQKSISENKKLTPGDVLQVCLELTDGQMYDALMTCHNTLRKDLRSARSYEKKKENLNIQLKNAKKMIAHPDSTLKQTMRSEDTIKEANKNLNDLNKAQQLLNSLEDIRQSDKVGAWYHLYGTMAAGYSQSDNVKIIPRWARMMVWAEHVIAKPYILGGGEMDKIEYCWDRWGADLGNDMYDKVNA